MLTHQYCVLVVLLLFGVVGGCEDHFVSPQYEPLDEQELGCVGDGFEEIAHFDGRFAAGASILAGGDTLLWGQCFGDLNGSWIARVQPNGSLVWEQCLNKDEFSIFTLTKTWIDGDTIETSSLIAGAAYFGARLSAQNGSVIEQTPQSVSVDVNQLVTCNGLMWASTWEQQTLTVQQLDWVSGDALLSMSFPEFKGAPSLMDCVNGHVIFGSQNTTMLINTQGEIASIYALPDNPHPKNPIEAFPTSDGGMIFHARTDIFDSYLIKLDAALRPQWEIEVPYIFQRPTLYEQNANELIVVNYNSAALRVQLQTGQFETFSFGSDVEKLPFLGAAARAFLQPTHVDIWHTEYGKYDGTPDDQPAKLFWSRFSKTTQHTRGPLSVPLPDQQVCEVIQHLQNANMQDLLVMQCMQLPSGFLTGTSLWGPRSCD